jgi:hypothetical protein
MLYAASAELRRTLGPGNSNVACMSKVRADWGGGPVSGACTTSLLGLRCGALLLLMGRTGVTVAYNLLVPASGLVQWPQVDLRQILGCC